MFQYATSDGRIYEDTGLLTRQEAEEYRNKYYDNAIIQLQKGNEPQMCIWCNCENNVDYHTIMKEINYYNEYEIIDGKAYLIEKKKTIIT